MDQSNATTHSSLLRTKDYISANQWSAITDVPSLSSRAAAPAELRSFLEVVSAPNGSVRADGFAEFASGFANPARHDVGSIKVDHVLSDMTMLRARYNFADSDATQRGPVVFHSIPPIVSTAARKC